MFPVERLTTYSLTRFFSTNASSVLPTVNFQPTTRGSSALNHPTGARSITAPPPWIFSRPPSAPKYSCLADERARHNSGRNNHGTNPRDLLRPKFLLERVNRLVSTRLLSAYPRRRCAEQAQTERRADRSSVQIKGDEPSEQTLVSNVLSTPCIMRFCSPGFWVPCKADRR